MSADTLAGWCAVLVFVAGALCLFHGYRRWRALKAWDTLVLRRDQQQNPDSFDLRRLK